MAPIAFALPKHGVDGVPHREYCKYAFSLEWMLHALGEYSLAASPADVADHIVTRFNGDLYVIIVFQKGEVNADGECTDARCRRSRKLVYFNLCIIGRIGIL